MASGISPGGRPIDESPLSSSKTSNYVARRGGLPPYIRGVARGIDPANPDSPKAISEAIAAIERWAATSKNPAVKAAAIKALAQWRAITRSSGVGPDSKLSSTQKQALDVILSSAIVSAQDGPRMTAPMQGGIYAKLVAKGMKPNVAKAFASRAAARSKNAKGKKAKALSVAKSRGMGSK